MSRCALWKICATVGAILSAVCAAQPGGMERNNNSRAQQQQELEEKAQDALNWRKYYTQHSFKYNRGRLVKRIIAKKRVLLKTLKKYQLVQFYKENLI